MSRIGPSHGTPGVLPIVFRPTFVPWWMTTICTLTPCCRSRSDSALIRGASARNVRPARCAGRDELRRVLQLGADHADLDAVDREHLRRRHPVGRVAGRRLDDVRGEEREVRPRPGAAAAARRRSRTRGCRTTWRRGPTRSRRRSPACPRAGASSAARRRRCRPPARIRPGPGSDASSSSNSVARNAPPPTGWLIPSNASVVGLSWPWKSFRPMIEIGL